MIFSFVSSQGHEGCCIRLRLVTWLGEQRLGQNLAKLVRAKMNHGNGGY